MIWAIQSKNLSLHDKVLLYFLFLAEALHTPYFLENQSPIPSLSHLLSIRFGFCGVNFQLSFNRPTLSLLHLRQNIMFLHLLVHPISFIIWFFHFLYLKVNFPPLKFITTFSIFQMLISLLFHFVFLPIKKVKQLDLAPVYLFLSVDADCFWGYYAEMLLYLHVFWFGFKGFRNEVNQLVVRCKNIPSLIFLCKLYNMEIALVHHLNLVL